MSTSLASLSTNFFPSPQNGFTTTLASTIASGATTVPLNSVAGFTNGQIAAFVIEPTSSTAKQTFTGVIDTSGVQVTSVVWTAGTNQTHAGGATVVDYATATHIGMITKGITQQHTQAGAHTAITATSLAATGNISSSTGTINAATVSSLQDTGVALSTYRNEAYQAFVVSGGVWTGDAYASTKNASMTALVCHINGQRGTISAVTAHGFTASKDTYVDVLNTAGVFTLVYTEVTNNAASPALAANSLRLAIVVTGASNIAAAASINQGSTAATTPVISSQVIAVSDSLGNLIYPNNSSPKLIGYVASTGTVSNTPGADVPGASITVNVPAGRRLKLIASMPFTGLASSNLTQALIKEGSTTVISPGGFTPTNNTTTSVITVTIGYLTPTAGVHTYKVTSNMAVANANVNSGTIFSAELD